MPPSDHRSRRQDTNSPVQVLKHISEEATKPHRTLSLAMMERERQATKATARSSSSSHIPRHAGHTRPFGNAPDTAPWAARARIRSDHAPLYQTRIRIQAPGRKPHSSDMTFFTKMPMVFKSCYQLSQLSIGGAGKRRAGGSLGAAEHSIQRHPPSSQPSTITPSLTDGTSTTMTPNSQPMCGVVAYTRFRPRVTFLIKRGVGHPQPEALITSSYPNLYPDDLVTYFSLI